MNRDAANPKRWRLPIATWINTYEPRWLSRDLVAGATLAAYAIPVSLAYASLAGLPPHSGIYCYLLGGLAYALLGTSRQVAIGPTSAIAMLVGTTVAGMAGGDSDRWAAIAALTALVVAVLSVLAWGLRLSGLMSFVSEVILTGFKVGAALTIGLTQLPKLFGVPGGGEHFLERLWILAGQLPQTNGAVLAFGLTAMAALLVGEKWLPGRPVALAVVAVSIAVMKFTSLEQLGLSVVGDLPRGLPEFRVPSLRLRDLDGVVPLAAACFLLSYIESVSAARTMAAKNGYEINARRELLGLGAANLAVAFGSGFPVAGGLSQTAVNDNAGARSPLALVFASTSLGICLLYLTGLLHDLPNVVLASVVLVAVKGLVDVQALTRLFRASRREFRIAMVALAGVLLLGILNGVLLAAVVSLLTIIAGTARPTIAFLGRIPGTARYSDSRRHPENESSPGLLIFRIEGSLLYFNVDHVRQVVEQRIADTPNLAFVVCDLSNSPYVDLAGARLLEALHQVICQRGAVLRLAEPHARVRDLLRATGMEQRVGPFDRRSSLSSVIAEFEATRNQETRG